MKSSLSFRTILLSSLVIVTCAAAQPSAQSGRPARWRLYGDWQLKVEFGDRQMNAILSFSRNSEGNLTAQWISLWGVVDLKDVKFEENKLSFVQVVQFGDNEFTSNFMGTIVDGKLTGTLSSDRGESNVEGVRSPRVPGAVGNWEMKFTVGEREVTTELIVTADQEGNLKGQWDSQWGEHVITDIAYERRNLTFKRTSTFQDRQMKSTFEGTIEGDALSGVITSEMGEFEVSGTRKGAAAIGTWNLEVTAEWGTIHQRLQVNPDMSGLYGTVPVKKVNLKDGRMDFEMLMEFGDQSFEMKFDGKLEDSKLSGEMTTSRGTQKIKGTKVVRPVTRRGAM